MSATDTIADMRRRAPNGVAPVDYGKLNAVYATALVGVAIAARRRGGAGLRQRELLPLGAATFALSKVVAKEKVGTWVREPFVHQDEPDDRPRGVGVRAAVGELLTCTRCVGAWSAAALVGLRVASPEAGRAVQAVLAASAINDFLQAGFNYSTARSDAAARRS